MTANTFFSRHRAWMIALAALALVQVACIIIPAPPGYIYWRSIIDFCSDEVGRARYYTSQQCYDAIETSCPDVNLSQYSVCAVNSMSPALPSPDSYNCAELTLNLPPMVERTAESLLIEWGRLSAAHYYTATFDTLESTFRPDQVNGSLPVALLRANGQLNDGLIDIALHARFNQSTLCTVTGQVLVVDPPPTLPAPPIRQLDCSPFRLTSPLDGLPNGVTTFYWDPLPGASGYRLTVADAATGAPTASLSTGAQASSAALDLSSAAVGGGTQFIVTVEALLGSETVCISSAALNRAWPAPPSADNPPSDPACGDGICAIDLGENLETCPADCAAG